VFGVGVENACGDGLERGELRSAQVLCDVEGAGFYELLQAKVGWGLGDRPEVGYVVMHGTDGHDTTLLMLRGLRSCIYWTLERGGKVSFGKARFSPKSVIPI
jgi:hypothetical protein